jgi:spectinomycin phosphotransferase
VVAVYSYFDGKSGRFGEPLPPGEREQVVQMLARLHQATPAVASLARNWPLQVASRVGLEDALHKLDQHWVGGPFSEPARTALAGGATAIARLLETFDRLADEVAYAGIEPVITHGEPHPGNLMSADGRLFMVDWDTVALGPPERDLWMVSTCDANDDLARYTRASGRQVNRAALRLYRTRWLLDDFATSVDRLRSAHDDNADTQRSMLWLSRTLASPDLDRWFANTRPMPSDSA